MTILIISIVCGIIYAIKGGSGNVLKNWNYVRDKNKILDRVLDGKVLSTFLFFVMSIVLFGFSNPVLIIPLTIAWLVSVAPSMGEEHGSIGDYKEGWGKYIERGFPRDYGIKKCVQRGLVFGAAFTAATGYIPFLWLSLLFVPSVFIGQCLNRLVLDRRGWTLAEPIIGAFVVGIPLGMFFVSQ